MTICWQTARRHWWGWPWIAPGEFTADLRRSMLAMVYGYEVTRWELQRAGDGAGGER